MSSPESPAPPDPASQPKSHVSARVPEQVSRGVFSNGVVVMSGATEFILDFVQNFGYPPHVAARVVMPHATVPQFIDALRKNIEMYVQRFGQIPELPRPAPGAKQQTAQEVYDELKLSDDLLAGSYANGVMIGHSASEFKFDFLSNLFPHAAVSARVFLAGPQVPRFLESLQKNYQQFVQRVQQQQLAQQQLLQQQMSQQHFVQPNPPPPPPPPLPPDAGGAGEPGAPPNPGPT